MMLLCTVDGGAHLHHHRPRRPASYAQPCVGPQAQPGGQEGGEPHDPVLRQVQAPYPHLRPPDSLEARDLPRMRQDGGQGVSNVRGQGVLHGVGRPGKHLPLH